MEKIHEDFLKAYSQVEKEDEKCIKIQQYQDVLKGLQGGWKFCITILKNEGAYEEIMIFGLLQVIEHFIRNEYDALSEVDQQELKHFLNDWIQIQATLADHQNTPSVRNKAAQIFAMICVKDYPQRYVTFFDDLLETLKFGPGAVDNYLRVLKQIDCEVADRGLLRTNEETERSRIIKDAMRTQCIPKLVSSWDYILKTYMACDPALTCRCLEVLGSYSSWIDINLVISEPFAKLYLELLHCRDIREAAVDCLHNIVKKGMDPRTKVILIQSLVPVLQNADVLQLHCGDETEFVIKLASLVNIIGTSLIDARNKLLKSCNDNDMTIDGQSLLKLDSAIESKILLTFPFLGHESHEVSTAVLEFCKDYIHMLKGSTRPNTDGERKCAREMLRNIIEKMKYKNLDENLQEGKESASQECRIQYKVIFENIIGLDPVLVYDYTDFYLRVTLRSWQVAPVEDVEIAITLLYFLGESLLANCTERDKVKFLELIQILIESGVNSHPHPAVALQYLETMVRYGKILLLKPEFIASVLLTFLNQRCMHNPSYKIRKRCMHLFCKFIKLSRSFVAGLGGELLHYLRDLLLLPVLQNGSRQQWVDQDDQLILYEAAGILIVHSNLSLEEKQIEFKSLVKPLLEKFDQLMDSFTTDGSDNEQQLIAKCICHIIALTSRCTKGFSDHSTVQQCGCSFVFQEALLKFLTSLQVPVFTPMFQTSIRLFLHRMIICLDEDILQYIPKVSEHILMNHSIHTVQEYIPVLIQLVTKFKKKVIPTLQETIAQVVRMVWTCLSESFDANEENLKRERDSLKRNYCQLMATVSSEANDTFDLLNAQDSTFIEQVTISITDGARNSPDPVAQKYCFATLRTMVLNWTEGRLPEDPFVQFMYMHILPACFDAPLKTSFDISDAATVNTLNEIAHCVKSMYQRRKVEFIYYLDQNILPVMQLTDQQKQEFIAALIRLDDFVPFFKNFFESRR